MLAKQKAGTKYYTKYVCTDLDQNGQAIPGAEMICHFGDSATILGVRIGGKVCLTEDEAVQQIVQWNAIDVSDPPGTPNTYIYSLYTPEMTEAGVTPPLPGMSDQDMQPKTRAGVGHVVGQGGCCWCGAFHQDAVSGDPVSLPEQFGHDVPFMAAPFATYGPDPVDIAIDPGGNIYE